MTHLQRPPPQRQYTNGPQPQNDGRQNQVQRGHYDPGQQHYGHDVYEGYQNDDDRGSYDDGYGTYGSREQFAPKQYHNQSRGVPQYHYEYGDRYRTNAPPDAQHFQLDRQNLRPAPLQQWPRPSGETPLNTPTSPTKTSLDSPFPAFPIRRRGNSTDLGIGKRMAGLDISDGPVRMKAPDVRPHTSHSNRPQPLKLQTEPLGRREPLPNIAGEGSGGNMGSSNNGGYGFPLSQSPTVHSPLRPPKRSATMPVNSAPGVNQPQYPGQSVWREPPHILEQYGPDSQPPVSPRGASAAVELPANSKINPTGEKEDPEKSASRDATQNGPAKNEGPADEIDPTHDFLKDYFDSAAPPEPDMPNFSAMPDAGPSGSRGIVVHDGLIPIDRSQTHEPSTPQNGSGYTAYRPPEGASQSPSGSSRLNEPNQFENAGFQFDLPEICPPSSSPGSNQKQPSDGYGDPMNGQYSQRPGGRGIPVAPYRDVPSSRGGYGPRPAPIRYGSPMQDNGGPKPFPEISAPQNPDALPHHPAPYRPGLDRGPMPPPPVRHYDIPPVEHTPPVQGPPPPPTNERRAPSAITYEELQRVQQAARANPSDQKAQLLLAKRLVEASTHLVDDGGRADSRTKAKNRERYIIDAYKIVKKLVSAGYPNAMFYLADCYGVGKLGLEVDPREAFSLYQSAAKAGHPESAYRLAVCCEIGQEGGGGTRRDPIKAVQWYRRAAALGDTPAMYKMGMILLKGLLGQQKNPREALSWLKRAAERADEDNPHALHELALLYNNPNGNDAVIQDEEYACELLHQAGELGYKFSQYRLGAAYEYGLMGCPVDSRQSIYWYSRAAAQGEHESELSLSGWYLTGAEGILQQNDTEAYLWARKAAMAGLAKAEYAMGYFTEVGIGVPANLDDAKRWYWKASSQNFQKARERLEDLRRGGAKMQKTRVSRSAVSKQSEGDCVVM